MFMGLSRVGFGLGTNTQVFPKSSCHRNDRDIVQGTTREYRHLAGFNRFRAWNEGQKKRHPEYMKIIAAMPSFKTASYEKILERLGYFWSTARFLLQFRADSPFLKWKFFQKRMVRVAVDAIVKRIVRSQCQSFDMHSIWKLEQAHGNQRTCAKSSQGIEAGLAEACNSGLHGRVQDEEALLAVPPDAFFCSILRQHEAPETKEA
ncbi:unnamed protein product [Phytophthora fragariaefolia]|uniref:Unnamed protein product n=1 Tax=Phytophthora fragariaefolia TaxID=1490495 RepID=A0A9W7D9U9_9STRA|nr:unnamed protein product [Phytophthora fragariaefolia]